MSVLRGRLEAMLSLRSLLGWTAGPVVVAAAAGAYPAWMLGGRDGVASATAACAIVLAAMIAGGPVMLRAGARGAQYVVSAFTLFRLARPWVCIALAVVAWLVFGLPPRMLLIWTGVFYLAMLAGECLWVGRAMRPPANESADKQGRE